MTSLWEATAPPAPPRPPLPGDRDADVAVVGAGYTGLWTALALLRRDPTLRVLVLEGREVGFGASGRNGGWCSALLPMDLDAVAAATGRNGAIRMQRAMFDAVADVIDTARTEAIDCDLAQGGYVELARSAPQLDRVRAGVEQMRRFGFGDEHLRLLTAAEARSRVGATSVLGGAHTPHCAALHPLRLVRGLARAVEQRGAVIHEGSFVRSIEPGLARTDRGTVRANVIVRATEAYSAALPGLRRRLLPVYSLMVATPPLPPTFWSAPAWPTGRRSTMPAASSSTGSAPPTDGWRSGAAARRITTAHGSRPLRPRRPHAPRPAPGAGRAVPVPRRRARGAPLGWPAGRGPRLVGVGRLRPCPGIVWAGGYVGDGVAASNLAGRTLAALITGDDPDDLGVLSWVGRRSPLWEPEPLRWLGVRAATRLTASADRAEAHDGHAPPVRSALARVITRPPVRRRWWRRRQRHG